MVILKYFITYILESKPQVIFDVGDIPSLLIGVK